MNVGVILSGCGVLDGSEIHEAVITLLCLDQRGATYQCLAPSKSFDAIDHTTKRPTGEKRNVLVESARIARGNIQDLAKAKGSDFDALILPGGYGAAKNLCSFATEGADCSADSQVRRVLREAHAAGKPIGFICIAPAVAAKVFSDVKPKLTIGHDASTAAALTKMGAQHVECDVREFTVDEKNRIVSTPAYMEAKSIKEAYDGISRLVDKVMEMAK